MDISQKVGLPKDRAAEAHALAIQQMHAWSRTGKDHARVAARAKRILKAKSVAEVHSRGWDRRWRT